jgi:hypothetical protein
MQNPSLQPLNQLGQQQQQQYSHVGPEQEHGRRLKPVAFHSSEEVEAFMNQAAAQNRHYDLELLPGEAGSWRSGQSGMYQPISYIVDTIPVFDVTSHFKEQVDSLHFDHYKVLLLDDHVSVLKLG